MKKYVLFTLLCASLYSYAGISPTFPNYSAKTIDVTKSIGTVSGSHGVGSDGSFGYTIPLYIPDGINGVQPSISINYNSRGGNGMLGWGWDVSAFSAISLDNKGLYYDNSVAPMTLKGINNTFSLSGNKLSLTNGSFGFNGSEYRTFEEGDSKISVSGNIAGCSSCPDKFIVQTKSGLTIEYGGSASTRIANADGIPLSWRISKIKDLYGNYAEYQYIQQNSEWVLDKIIYTKNDATGITAANTIQFTYIARNAGTDNNKFYIAGTNTSHLEIFQNNVLDKIDITSEGDMVRTYQFNYTNTGEYTYLTEVIETAYEGVTPKTLNSTMFKYGDAPLNETENFSSTLTQNLVADILTGDFTGDGFTDICAAEYTTDAYGKKYTQLKFYEKLPNQNSFSATPIIKTLPATSLVQGLGTLTLYGGMKVADSDGDGKDEVVFGRRGRLSDNRRFVSGFDIYECNGASVTTTSFTTDGTGSSIDSLAIETVEFFATGDFNGDSRDDIISVDRDKFVFHNPSATSYNNYYGTTGVFGIAYQNLFSVNFDGDAKDEIAVFDVWDDINYVGSVTTSVTATYFLNGEPNYSIFFGDFNGDGREDILNLCAVTPTIKYSNGKVVTSVDFSFTEALNMTSIFNETEYVRVADFNGDGKADIAHYYTEASIKKIAIYYSLGMSFKRVVVNQDFYQLSKYFGDFNADGRTETLHYDVINNILMVQYRSKGKERLLTNIKDGYLRETVVDYKLFPEGGTFYTYTPSPSNIYPLRVFQPRTFGVEKITVPNGTGDITQTTSFNYQYQNAKAHLTGKGFVGFEVMKTIDNLTGFVSESKTERIYNVTTTALYDFAVTETKLYPNANPAQLIVKQQYLYNTDGIFPIEDAYYPRAITIQRDDYVKDIHTVTDIKMDSLGNTLNRKQTINGSTELINSGYADWVNAGSWQLSRPQTIYDTITRSGQSAYITKTTLEYNAKGQITKQTQFANDVSKQVVTDLEYNATYGQLTKETVTAPGETPRYTRYEYKANQRTLDKVYNAQNEAIATVTAYDKRYNMPTAVTGYYANYSNSITLDAFGRVLSTTIQPNNFTNTYSYVWNNSGNEISYVQATLVNAPDTKVHYDKLGRPYKTETENYAGNYIAQTNTFNSLGQVITTSAPDANGNTLTTTYTYADAYYRLTQQANSFATTNYTYSNPASGQVKVVTNIINGEMREITTDASGMMVKATDAAGTLNYTYNSQHNLIEVKLGADIINTMTYDAVTGYQTGLTEPNSGTSTYVYNGFGELKSQTRNGQTTTLAYDVLGRPTTRTEPDGTYTYTYVTTGNGKNQLQNIKKGGVIDQQYTYDALHRVVTFDQKIDGTSYTTAYEYNTYNDITKITYPGTFSVDYAYNARGMLTHIYKGGTTNVIYQVNSTNVLGQVTGYTLGNGKTSATTYQNNGMPSNFSTTGIQNLTMVFDLTTGNLTSRTDVHNGNQTEAFTYETALDRLKTIAYNGGTPVTIDYGTSGNITQKYDAGTYTYDNTKKNAVKTTTLACGVTGAQSTNPQTIVYSHFNKPLKISQNGVVDTFMYNNNHDRIKTQLTASGVTTTRLFVGNYERETKSTGGAARHIYYIYGPDGLVCIAVKLGTNAPQYFYTYTDHLGSIVAVTNTAGVVQGEQSYDAWGRQRNADNWTDYAGTGTITLNGFVLDRGYTGHQHLKEFGIINMNGRLYDPIVGRMLNPDNFVQDATSTQAFNRYSYVVNNPLKYTDPSGWLRIAPDMVDLDYESMMYVNSLVSDYYNGAHSWNSGGGTGQWVQTNVNYTTTQYQYEWAYMCDRNENEIGGQWVVVNSHLNTGTKTILEYQSNFTQPFSMGMTNVVAPTGDMAAMGGGTQNGGNITYDPETRANELLHRFLLPNEDKMYSNVSHPFINSPAIGHNYPPIAIEDNDIIFAALSGAAEIDRILCMGDPNYDEGCLTLDSKSDYNKIYENSKVWNDDICNYISYDLIAIAEWNALKKMYDIIYGNPTSGGLYNSLNQFGISIANIEQIQNSGINTNNLLIWKTSQNQITYIVR